MEDISILYVEDEQSIVSFAKILFKKSNISNITYASNGQEALKLYSKNRYDIIFTDMMMPIMDGFTLIEKIREIDDRQIFIMVTGLENKDDLIRAIELRVAHFIEKPINPKKFYTILEHSCRIINEKKELELSNKLLEQYKQAIDDTTIVSKTTPQGIITYVNEQFCKISGYTKEELIGKPHSLVRDPSTEKSTFKDMWSTIQKKQTWRGKIKNKIKDGGFYIVEAVIIPIIDANNRIIEYMGIRHDITELEKYKEILQCELDDTSKTLKENLNLSQQYEDGMNRSTAILRTDTNNIITFANDEFCKISGFDLDELIGKNCSSLRDKKHIAQQDCKNMQTKLKKNEVISITFKNISKSGKPYYTNTIVYPIVNLNGETIEHLHLMHDITEILELSQEIEDTQKEVVFTMGAIGETRSKETGNHVKRVAEYSYTLAKLYGLSDEESELIKMASPMHDIGKVGIPDSILNKPARLTKDEFEIMKTHSSIGYEMLKGSSRPILKASSHIALEHHERWDGKGYPNGLSGEEIHIYGRITAICDVFDALGSDRCYKKAWDLEKILKLFNVESGQQFDPNLMNLFLENLDIFLEIQDKYVD
ncbi:MAG: PAS domain S-box protein [Campylobacterota bacterium]|nr:PAS domain S-box protein [Campylobacterota bacterium]